MHCLSAASRAAQDLEGVEEFEVPQWRALAAGLRPPPREPEEFEPGCQRVGWQHETSSRVEREFRRNSVLNRMSGRDRALLRSQSGPVPRVSLSTTPSSPLTRIEPALFRCCFSGVLPSRCPFPTVPASVAVHLTPLATTVQRARGVGCSGEEGSLWKVPLGGSAERPGLGWPQTSSSEIWILECPMQCQR